ncbi:MAG: SoxR reducing system RseC family protein [Tissierellia bacterium]|nr:SoxR reducing system RseC family protein [Tissierellia bacterium]
MKVKARVVDYKDGKALLETIPEGQCVGCKGCSGAEPKQLEVRSKPIEAGEDVLITMDNSNVTKAAIMAYGIPLIVFMLGLFLTIALLSKTSYHNVGELVGLAVGLVLFAITYLLLRRGEKRRSADPRYQAKIFSND